jgi:hypothetical protein
MYIHPRVSNLCTTWQSLSTRGGSAQSLLNEPTQRRHSSAVQSSSSSSSNSLPDRRLQKNIRGSKPAAMAPGHLMIHVERTQPRQDRLAKPDPLGICALVREQKVIPQTLFADEIIRKRPAHGCFRGAGPVIPGVNGAHNVRHLRRPAQTRASRCQVAGAAEDSTPVSGTHFHDGMRYEAGLQPSGSRRWRSLQFRQVQHTFPRAVCRRDRL